MTSVFTSRISILCLLLLVLGTLALSYVVPQRSVAPDSEIQQWTSAEVWRGLAVRYGGIDHIFTTPWFAILLGVFLLSLVLSTRGQIEAARKKTFGIRGTGGHDLLVSCDRDLLGKMLRRAGYIRTAGEEQTSHFIRHPWGHWGGVVLHAGLVIVICSALLLTLTQKRGVAHLVEGETFGPGGAWVAADSGLAATPFSLPFSVTLRKVRPEFWGDDSLKQLMTELEIATGEGKIDRALAINELVRVEGIKIYQQQAYGHAFFAILRDPVGREVRSILTLQMPVGRDKASYRDFPLPDRALTLRTKYYADSERGSMAGERPLLVCRLVRGEEVLAEAPLLPGGEGRLGDYTVHLDSVRRWAGIIFVETTGLPGVFCGFLFIIVGGGLTYFAPPRDLFVTREGGRLHLCWRAGRFAAFYREELDAILREAGAVNDHD